MNNRLPVPYGGLLKIAVLPADNPTSLGNFLSYDLTPVDHDYSGQFPKKANHVFRKLGLPIRLVMVVGDPANAAEIYSAFRRDPAYVGGGTGSGFKNRALAVLDSLDPLAEQIGAVNVVKKIAGRLRGYNTDGSGFVSGLEELLLKQRGLTSVKGLKVLVIGAGGTADAIAFTLASKGARVVILNRTTEKAEKLAERICKVYGDVAFGGGEDLLAEKLPWADVAVNASTKGAEGPFKDFAAFAPAKEGALEENLAQSAEAVCLLDPQAIVCDINLRADESPTLRLAREAGHVTQDGGPMNFHQAVLALWIIHEDLFALKGVTTADVARLIKEVS
jgi:shikimate dehydrogenase